MSLNPHEKYERFRHILQTPLDEHPSGAFPIVAGDMHFDLSQYASESTNYTPAIFSHMVEAHPDKLFLDLGCGRREKTYDNCLYLEVYPSNSADLIVDPTCLYPIKDQSLYGIGCFAVLEHCRKPRLVVQEIYRMLVPGGNVMIDWPFLQPVHGYPNHYFNATREGLTSIFADRGFEISHAFTGEHQSPAYTLRWVIQWLLYKLPDAERKVAGKVKLHQIVGWDPHGPEWRQLLDALPDEAKMELACGNMLVAKKPGEPSETLHRDDPPNLPDVPLPEATLVTSGKRPGLLYRIHRALGR
ncbi:methyltransferase domain-containing protein (plasmid) [Methylobacterium sp. NMS12]|uniref:methyltransferase domain-containing protein n=1 Tax=Methylobacterium sp. NMS12 TaxID=3079766 RepID=UPI003F88298C